MYPFIAVSFSSFSMCSPHCPHVFFFQLRQAWIPGLMERGYRPPTRDLYSRDREGSSALWTLGFNKAQCCTIRSCKRDAVGSLKKSWFPQPKDSFVDVAQRLAVAVCKRHVIKSSNIRWKLEVKLRDYMGQSSSCSSQQQKHGRIC